MNKKVVFLNDLYTRIAKALDISETLFQRAVTSYQTVGNYLSNCAPNYNISIYPQGSFKLGTVIKPYFDNDEYDLDFVCEINNGKEISALQLKTEIGGWLKKDKRYSNKIEEKKRCWTIEYADSAQFHMDITPALPSEQLLESISVTTKISEGEYEYSQSNPKGYANWFYKRMEVRRNELRQAVALSKYNADISRVPDFEIKTPLQQAIQILKRHRDIMFLNDAEGVAPISVIITTLAAWSYNNESNLYETLVNIINKAPNFIIKKDNKYWIYNPSNPNENFAEKWNEDIKKANAFFEWIKKSNQDIILNPMNFANQVEIANELKKSLGEGIISRVFSAIGEETREGLNNKQIGITPTTGILAAGGGIVGPTHRNYGSV